ncbi:MAG: sugar ABC transporter substrate-binding protein [Solirubrobacteraceae bacterium]
MRILSSPLQARFAAVAAAGLAAVAVAGCGSSKSSSESSTSAASKSSTATTASSTSAAATVPFESAETSLPTSYQKPSKGSFKVGYLNPSGAQESLIALQEGLVREVKSQGGTVTTLDAKLSVNEQVTQFEQLINEKVAAIAVYPLDPGALAPLVKKAKAAGIPVVGIGETTTPTTAPGFASQVWLGPDQNAYLIAQTIAKDAPGAKVGFIGFAAPVPFIHEIVERVKYWGKKFGLTILGEQDNKTDDIPGGEAAATGLIGQYPEMNALFTYNEDSALGAYSALRSSGQQGKVKIFSNNGASEGIRGVKSGRIVATFQFHAIQTGKLAAEAALDAAAKVKLPPVVVIPKPTEINASNVDQAKTLNQQLQEEG